MSTGYKTKGGITFGGKLSQVHNKVLYIVCNLSSVKKLLARCTSATAGRRAVRSYSGERV